MALLERQERILEYLKAHKNATVKTLSKMLFVSEATLRRDLQELQSMGLIERNHGGARLHENADEISIFFRLQKNAKEKERGAFLCGNLAEFDLIVTDEEPKVSLPSDIAILY